MNPVEENKCCVICFGPLNSKFKTKCGHYCCLDCIFPWIFGKTQVLGHAYCPLCRQGIGLTQKVRLIGKYVLMKIWKEAKDRDCLAKTIDFILKGEYLWSTYIKNLIIFFNFRIVRLLPNWCLWRRLMSRISDEFSNAFEDYKTD